ncbi:uncharacterized protein [Amphiura filiformis]|uniref:uncharacterized protein n=1 Tax=Amphiura filiformis TaxID=82378 RepID=UPI003B21A7D6
MKMNLVVLIAGIFIMFCNSANSELVDCIAFCDHCAEVSDTLKHMSCTKNCDELKKNDNGKISCSKLTARIEGSLSLENEIDAINARKSELIKSGDYSTIVEELFTNDCININNGQAPVVGKEDMEKEWLYWFGSNHINRLVYVHSAFGESDGEVWEDGTLYGYKDDVLIGSNRYMHVYKRVDGTLLNYINIYFN